MDQELNFNVIYDWLAEELDVEKSKNKQDGSTMWTLRTKAFLDGLFPALMHLQNNGEMRVNASNIYDFLKLEYIVSLLLYPTLPKPLKDALKKYLFSIPAFDIQKGVHQSELVFVQHGYLQAGLNEIIKNHLSSQSLSAKH